ncbi:hypothetical protein D3C76_1657580 [compost metagenome]
MHGNEVGATHVPMRLLGDQRQVGKLHHLMVQRLDGFQFGFFVHVITSVKQLRRFRFHQFSGTHIRYPLVSSLSYFCHGSNYSSDIAFCRPKMAIG